MELIKVCKFYDRPVLKDVSIKFLSNNIYLLKGISGSGKTTLLNIIGGIDKDFEGQYFYNNKDIKSNNEKENKIFASKVGYIFQKSLLISHFNILDNLLFIRNDKSKIFELAERFNISKLLKKFPKELSGGERQRIAIVRVLLLDPKIIIADEPTASLGYNDAIEFVKYLKMLSNDNRIIIIASHSDIFDSIANCIINIDYGKLKVVINNQFKPLDNNQKNEIKKKITKNQLLMDFKYSINKCLKGFHFLSILFLIVVFFLILSAISLKQNFKFEYGNYLKREYPFNTIYISTETYGTLKGNIKLKKYDNYSFKKGNIEYLPLLPKRETILGKSKYIKKGRFPENKFEVLVNNEYIETIFNKKDIQLGKIIVIEKIEFKIVGIISANETYLNDIYNSNYYYNLTYNPQVFIPYEIIKKINNNSPIKSEMVMVTFEDLYSNEKLYNSIITEDNQNCWSDKLNNFSYSLDVFLDIFFVSIGFISLVLFIFIANQILLNLFYRRNEIGYLQLFGITKRRLKRILLIEYSLKYILSLFLAIVLYFMGIELIKKYLLFDFMISKKCLLLIILIILIYCYFVIFIPLKIFLRKSIKSLIHN